MWAVPTFIATTWWSWRAVRPRSTGLSARLAAWWLVGAAATLGALAVATRRLAESSWDAPEWLLWGAVGGVLAVLLAIDVDVQLLPREVSLPAFVVALVFLSIVEGPADVGRWGPLLGALVMTTITLVLRIVSRGSLGMGDVLVSPLLGSVLGWFDPWAVSSAWIVAAFTGGVGAAISLWRGEPRQSLVAYGPFLIFGTVVALVVAAL
jgi:leader peptidase (prepilin peptidase)/N-methyltransferase